MRRFYFGQKSFLDSPSLFQLIKLENNSNDLKINELLKFSDEYRSWFCDEFVISGNKFEFFLFRFLLL